jgi:hypothetical protein
MVATDWRIISNWEVFKSTFMKGKVGNQPSYSWKKFPSSKNVGSKGT